MNRATRCSRSAPGSGRSPSRSPTPARVRALELDAHLLPALEEAVAGLDVTVIVGDALTFDLGCLAQGRWACVSNLPYNVATPVVVRLLEQAPTVTRFLVMVQREVGERLAAAPGHPDAGAVSVKVAYYADARLVGTVPRTVFIPAPGVDSVLVRLDRHPTPPVTVRDPEWFFALVRAGFRHRRKMLRGGLRAELGDRTRPALEAAGLAPDRRAESLTLTEWASLAEAVDALE